MSDVTGTGGLAAIDRHRAERDRIRDRLIALFADYERRSLTDLLPHEPEIVRLYNRFNEVESIIDALTEDATRRNNIATVWSLVAKLREEPRS